MCAAVPLLHMADSGIAHCAEAITPAQNSRRCESGMQYPWPKVNKAKPKALQAMGQTPLTEVCSQSLCNICAA